MSDLDMSARETWWSLHQMSYTGDRPDLRKQDVEEIASLIRDLAADARKTREALAARDALLREWLTYTGLRSRAFDPSLNPDDDEYASGRSLIERTDRALAVSPADTTPERGETE